MFDLDKFKVIDPLLSVIGPPDRELDWYDGPVLFTFHSGKRHLLFYLFEELDESDPLLCPRLRYLVVETTDDLIDALEGGRISLLGSLDMDPIWFVDTQSKVVDGEWCEAVEKCRIGSFDDIPGEMLPEPGVLLHFEDEEKRVK